MMILGTGAGGHLGAEQHGIGGEIRAPSQEMGKKISTESSSTGLVIPPQVVDANSFSTPHPSLATLNPVLFVPDNRHQRLLCLISE